MNLEKRICVEFGTKLSLVIFNCDSSIADVVSLCFKKFKIEGYTETQFCLALKEPLCWIEEPQDIRDGDRILLLEISYAQTIFQLNLLPEQQSLQKLCHKTEENNFLEILSRKESEESEESFLDKQVDFSFIPEKEESQSDGQSPADKSLSDQSFIETESMSEEEVILDFSSEEDTDNFPEIFDEIDLTKIMTQEFSSRGVLSQEINIWASEHKFRLKYETMEKKVYDWQLKKEVIVSILVCNQKGCPFHLRYTSNPENISYSLSSYWNTHNHELERRNTAKDITEAISKRIQELKSSTKDKVKLTKQINNEFNKSFSVDTIRYQLRKIKVEEFGIATEDAHKLIELLKKDSEERNYYFKTFVLEGKMNRVCWMTEKMKLIANKFNDIFIIDGSHKTNRFNMTLLDIIAIDNFGRSRTCFVALLEDLKTESYTWALQSFKESLDIPPSVIFTDEEDALVSGFSFFYS